MKKFISDFTTLYLNANGRISKKEYGLFFVITVWIYFFILSAALNLDEINRSVSFSVYYFGLFISPIFIWGFLCSTWKRIKDMNYKAKNNL